MSEVLDAVERENSRDHKGSFSSTMTVDRPELNWKKERDLRNMEAGLDRHMCSGSNTLKRACWLNPNLCKL